jgi:uncharacterized protein (TIGR02118 family)
MFRVSVIYPNGPGVNFNWAYYIDKHIVMVRKMLEGKGMVRSEVDKGIGTAQPGSPAPYVAMAHMYFNTNEDMQRCMMQGAGMMADIPNFTNIQPQVQISEIIA